eukprot:s8396_g4.t1
MTASVFKVSDNDVAEQEVGASQRGQLTVFERRPLGDSDPCLVQSNWLRPSAYCFGLCTALGILRMLFASDLDCDACGCLVR